MLSRPVDSAVVLNGFNDNWCDPEILLVILCHFYHEKKACPRRSVYHGSCLNNRMKGSFTVKKFSSSLRNVSGRVRLHGSNAIAG